MEIVPKSILPSVILEQCNPQGLRNWVIEAGSHLRDQEQHAAISHVRFQGEINEPW